MKPQTTIQNKAFKISPGAKDVHTHQCFGTTNSSSDGKIKFAKKRKQSNEKITIESTPSDDVASTKKQLPSQNWLSFMKTQSESQSHLKYNPKYKVRPTSEAKLSAEITDIVGIDCEMVGGGDKGRENLLARVSIVNKYGAVLYNTFVKPINNIAVTDYRTKYSGVRPANLATGKDFDEVQRTVANLLKDKVVVGHDLKNDFKVLFLSHPRRKIRDTAKYKPLKMYTNGNASSRPSLKTLADKILDIKIQQGEHDSIEDAKAAIAVYMLHQKEWEKSLRTNINNKIQKSSKAVRPHFLKV